MKVQIEGQLYLESDEKQFIMKEYSGKVTVDKDGAEREQYKTIGYYTNIHSALKYFMTMKIKETTTQTLSGLIAEVQTIGRYIESKFDYDVVIRPTKEADEGLEAESA